MATKKLHINILRARIQSREYILLQTCEITFAFVFEHVHTKYSLYHTITYKTKHEVNSSNTYFIDFTLLIETSLSFFSMFRY